MFIGITNYFANFIYETIRNYKNLDFYTSIGYIMYTIRTYY